MQVLLMGGTGNISTEVAAELAARNHQVTVATRGKSPVPKAYRHIATDRRDKAALCESLRDWRGDVAIDFLCFKPSDCEIVHEALKGKIKQFIFISTAAVYHKTPSTPLPLTEESAQGSPLWEYARLKIECEKYFLAANGPQFPVTILRPSHTLGIGRIPSPFCGTDFTVAARILAGKPVIVTDDGQRLWTVTASSDFAAALAGLVGADAAIGEAFHITSDQALTWNSIYFEIGLAFGRPAEIVRIPAEFICREQPHLTGSLQGDKAQHSVFDNAKIKRFIPDFECRKSVRRMMRESVAWLNEDDRRKQVRPEMDRLVESLIEKWRRRGG